MPNEHIDPIYKHVDDYIDDKLKIIKRELQTLKQAHDAVAAQQSQLLLETQRCTAKLMIHFTATNVLTNIRRQKPNKVHDIFTQLAVDATTATSEANTSEEPLLVASQFEDKYYERLQEWGIKLVVIS